MKLIFVSTAKHGGAIFKSVGEKYFFICTENLELIDKYLVSIDYLIIDEIFHRIILENGILDFIFKPKIFAIPLSEKVLNLELC